MKCNKCAALIPNDSVFCPVCGAPIDANGNHIESVATVQAAGGASVMNAQSLNVYHSDDINAIGADSQVITKGKSSVVKGIIGIILGIICPVIGWILGAIGMNDATTALRATCNHRFRIYKNICSASVAVSIFSCAFWIMVQLAHASM